MNLNKILEYIKNDIIEISEGDFSPNLEITSICSDSREVSEKSLFVAIKGFKTDGNDYVGAAEKLGAVAIISEEKVDTKLFLARVKNVRKALSNISAFFYEKPSEKLFIIGITGTNGKTTTSYLIENILKTAKKEVGVIGTINYRYKGKVFENKVTTPESLYLQKILFNMQKEGVTHAVLEVSSHSIDLLRIADIYFDTAVFTNLTQDHLDYHKTMEKYGECKARLFNEFLVKGPKKDKAFAVIDNDEPFGKKLYYDFSGNKISVGLKSDNHIYAENISYDISGITGRINTHKGFFDFKSPLIGKHNLENILCAVGASICAGIDLESIKRGIINAKNVPGRLENVENNKGFFIFIDYAHTPDALENVLLILNKLKKRRLITVFGCGGDRDKGKRPIMGAISDRLSDLSIITSDNPRSEYPNKIIEEIVSGIKGNFIVEPNRRKAINTALKEAKYEDTVLIAGKGHEKYQIIGDRILDFDDKKEIIKALD